jgi:hypothetical protein
MSKMLFQWLIVGLMALPSIGCAFGDRSVVLTYTPQAGTARTTDAGKVAVAAFDDLRQDKVVVGEVRNGYGLKTAKVVLNNQDPGGWVANAIASELQNAGYDVTKVAEPTAAADVPVIAGAISELYTKMYMSYRTTLQLSVVVTKAGVPIMNKQYTGQAKAGAAFVSTKEYETVMDQALQNALSQAIPDIKSALK